MNALLERMRRSRKDSQTSVVEVPKIDTSNSETLASQRPESLLKRRKRSADYLTTGDNLPGSSTPSDDQKHRSMVHREEVADRAVQRKELEEHRGIGDRSEA